MIFFCSFLQIISINNSVFSQDKKETKKTPNKLETGSDGENITITTTDGLRLSGFWFPGGKGKQSDCILMVHAYKQNMSKGPWISLAKQFQKEGFSVLMFDFRGHGKSTSTRAFGDLKKFSNIDEFRENRFSGVPIRTPNKIKGISFTSFKPQYYPFLVNDIAAARRFLDLRNDAAECNSGRITIIADRDMCAMSNFFVGTEFLRNGIYPKIPGAPPPEYNAGTDMLAVVYLSYRNSFENKLTVYQDALYRIPKGGREAFNGVRDKVGMAFVYSTEDKLAKDAANKAFKLYGIRAGQKEDPLLGKYIIESNKAAKLIGIDLMDEKIGINKEVIAFVKAMKKKGTNGSDWRLRNAENFEAIPVDLEYILHP